jgi:C1A family cysteine protease
MGAFQRIWVLIATEIFLCSAANALKINVTITSNKKLENLFVDFQLGFHMGFRNENDKILAWSAFAKNVEFVKTENKRSGRRFKLGINRFSHLTWENFKQQYLMKKGDLFKTSDLADTEVRKFPQASFFDGLGTSASDEDQEEGTRNLQASRRNARLQAAIDTLPKWVNWRNQVSPVKDQKDCSACYVFAALGAYEALINIKFGRKFTLSEQEIIDCSTFTSGCVGGNPADVFLYASQTGIARDSVYPYRAAAGTCRVIPWGSKIQAPVKFRYLHPDIFTVLKAISEGPTVLIHTVNQNFKNYESGVFDDPTCTDDLNHASIAVGYDLNASNPYIYLKNAWGEDWGENGFYKLAIGPLTADNKGTCLFLSHKYNVQPYF